MINLAQVKPYRYFCGMSIIQQIQEAVVKTLTDTYQGSFSDKDFQVNQTKPEFEGDYTVVLFSLVKSLKQSPDEIGNRLGAALTSDHPQLFTGFNIIKGFLNLTVNDAYWVNLLQKNHADICYGKQAMNGKK